MKFYYEITDGKYSKEFQLGDKEPQPAGTYKSTTQIDCTQFIPDAAGKPVAKPAPVVPEPPAPYVPTLAAVKESRKAYIKQRRNSEESKTPFEYNSSLFDYDSLSRERINAAISGSTIAVLTGMPATTVVANWRLYDNTERNMTAGDWMSFRQAEIARSAECFTTAAQLKSDIDAATTAAAVNQIDWPSPVFTWGNDAGVMGNDAGMWNNA